MNLGVLIVVAVPLALFMVAIIIATLREPSPRDRAAEHESPHLDAVAAEDETPAPTAELLAEATTDVAPSESDTPAEIVPVPASDGAITPADAIDASLAETPISESMAEDEPKPIGAELAVASQADESAPTAEQPGVAQTTEIAPTAEQPAVAQADEIAPTAEQAIVVQADEPSPTAEQAIVVQADEPSPTAEQPTLAQADENAPTAESLQEPPETIDPDEPILSGGPLILPSKGSPKFAFDYRGRLWVEKKNKSFFRQLRRPQLPPDEPDAKSG